MAIRLIRFGSGKTTSGLNRIYRIVRPDIEFEVYDPSKPDNYYDGMFTHNRIDDPYGGRFRRIIFLASRKSANLSSNKKAQARYFANPPLALWVNQETGRKLLEEAGIKARTMYRPNEMVIPDRYPAPPKEKKILWHYMSGTKWMPKKLEKQIANAMRALSDYEIRVINCMRREQHKPEGKGLDHVIPGGFLDLKTQTMNYHGVVRVYEVPLGVDLGRSTFQTLAYGRWYIYRTVEEPYVNTVRSVSEIPELVRSLTEKPDLKMGRQRWKYIYNEFNEEALHDRWVKAITETLNG